LKGIDWQEAEAHLETLGDCLRWFATVFAGAPLHFGHGTDEPWDDAVQLLSGALQLPEDRLQPLLRSRLLPSEVQRLVRLAQRRVEAREPVPYLTGRAVFAGLELQVDARVLIPRSPIAELIEREFSPWLREAPARVLDLCTGSGAIGLACAQLWPDAEVVLSDISEDALAVALGNRDRLGFDPLRVPCVRGDLFGPVSGRFDLIVSNPPYVPEASYARLPAEYLHEPKLALTAEHEGMAIVQRILLEASEHLSDQGVLVVEVGELAPAVEVWLGAADFAWVEFEQGGDGVLVITAAALAQFVQSRAASR
jgi:ribosomal protein L3 glutamine methyltransferase